MGNLKKMRLPGIVIGVVLCLAASKTVLALSITTSASGTFDGTNYGYEFTITEGTETRPLIDDFTYFTAVLENTSPTGQNPAPEIDLLAFNLDQHLTLGVELFIENPTPDWHFSAYSGGVKFDYIGERDTPDDRIQPGETLTFDFRINSEFLDNYANDLELWSESKSRFGKGIGGGDDFGQVAVSFQTLGLDVLTRETVENGGEGSDLLTSNWGTPVPEPATMLLFGVGLAGLAGISRRKKK